MAFLQNAMFQHKECHKRQGAQHAHHLAPTGTAIPTENRAVFVSKRYRRDYGGASNWQLSLFIRSLNIMVPIFATLTSMNPWDLGPGWGSEVGTGLEG